MWRFYNIFRILLHLFLIAFFVKGFINVSPDDCNCSGPIVHNLIWGSLGFLVYLLVLSIIVQVEAEEGEPETFDKRLFFWLFKLPKSKYKYEIKEAKDANNNTFYLPTVQTIRFFPAFYIKVDADNDTYELIDPRTNKKYYAASKEDALYAISLVKKDINNSLYKHKYGMLICRICPSRNECEAHTKFNTPTNLNVKIKKDF